MKKQTPLHYLGLLLVLAVFTAAALLLWRQLRENHLTFAKICEDLSTIAPRQMAVALAVTFVNFVVVLVCYDYLAFRFAEVPISLTRIAFAALTAYPVSYNFGATLFGGSLRYRLYSSWGIPLTKIVQLLVILALTFWFGVFFISGVLFVFVPLIPPDRLQEISTALAAQLHLSEGVVRLLLNSRLYGTLLLTVTGLYVGASLFHRGSLKIFRWTLPVPPFRLTLYQIGIAAADMLVAACVLYALFPPVRGGYLTVLEVYLVVYVLIVLSHVPGGWGVLEAGIMGLLQSLQLVSDSEIGRVAAGIIVFRVIYFLLPLLFAALMIGWHEYALWKKWISPLTVQPDEQAEGAAHAEGMNGDAGKSTAAEPKRRVPSK
jgi:uncharacterized membrane protein YbhN (UPF0104 family)